MIDAREFYRQLQEPGRGGEDPMAVSLHVLVADDMDGDVGIVDPAAHMARPGQQALLDLRLQAVPIVGRHAVFGIRHLRDSRIDRAGFVMGVGDRDIQRVADQVKRPGCRIGIDQPLTAVDPMTGVVDLVIVEGTGVLRGEAVDSGPQPGGFFAVQFARVEAEHVVHPRP